GRATAMLDGQVRSLGPMSWRERRLAGLGLLTVASWVVLGSRMNLAVISVLGAVGLFVLGISQWRRLQDYVNWGVIVMYGGAVAMGLALDETGALGPIVQAVVPAGLPSFAGLAGVGVLTIILTEGISNAAAVAIMLPAGFSLCETLGIAPVTMTLTVAVPAGLAFCLPISSPPNAIAYSGGYIRIRQMVRMGVAMNVVALAVFLAVARFYWPLIGVGL
ncbi:MAG: SLC13 family permease, partial [Phycisphaerae bacterium]